MKSSTTRRCRRSAVVLVAMATVSFLSCDDSSRVLPGISGVVGKDAGSAGPSMCTGGCPAPRCPIDPLPSAAVCATAMGYLSPLGLDLFRPDEKMCNPKGGDPSYVYVVSGEGIVVEGPPVDVSVGLCPAGGAPAISMVKGGFMVTMGPRLGYLITGDDFENELVLARGDVATQGDKLVSRFVLAASGDGVWHLVTIDALVNGKVVGSTAPITLEARSR